MDDLTNFFFFLISLGGYGGFYNSDGYGGNYNSQGVDWWGNWTYFAVGHPAKQANMETTCNLARLYLV